MGTRKNSKGNNGTAHLKCPKALILVSAQEFLIRLENVLTVLTMSSCKKC